MRSTRLVRAAAYAILICAAWGLAADRIAVAAVGRTEANVGVTPNGGVSYSMPIRVTEGIGGLAPSLAISYAGPETRTVLGVGFTLSGISYITPCSKSIAQDLVAEPIQLAAGDRYCLDGARLRLLAGTGSYGASESQYRTELDQLVRITAKGSVNGIPGWFRAEMTNGLIYEYGNTPDSKLLASALSGAPPQFWAVNRVSDRTGNSMSFHYTTDNSLRRFRPDYILYTASSAGASRYRVSFIYQGSSQPEPTLDFTPSASGDAAHSEDRLLERIELLHDGAIYRKVSFTYESGAANNKRLKTVQECVPGTPDDCLPATSLGWISSTGGHAASVASNTVALGVIPLDINGDGFEDLAWPSGGSWYYMLGGASGYGSVVATGFAGGSQGISMPLDWNGDGYMDVLADWTDGKWRVLQGSANGFLSPVHAGPGAGIPCNLPNTSWTVVDADNDGRDDLLRTNLSGTVVIQLRLNSPSGFGSETVAYTDTYLNGQYPGFVNVGTFPSSAERRPDFNGDGRTDLLIFACEWDIELGECIWTGWFQLMSQGTSYVNHGNLAQATADVRYGDFNADGLTDVLYLAPALGKWCLSFGQGGGGLYSAGCRSYSGYAANQIMTGDYDGDGYDDLYAAATSPAEWRVFRGSALGLASTAIATGHSTSGTRWMMTDYDGDSLKDMARADPSTYVWRTFKHLGVSGERLAAATDGLGNAVTFSYLPMTNSSVYTKGSGAQFPIQDFRSSAPLVNAMQMSPAGGTQFTLTYKYADARIHTQGRGFLGMGKREITDSRSNSLFVSQTYNQAFPYIGAPATTTVKQSPTGSVVQEVTHTYNNHLLDATSGNQRYLPYRLKTVTKAYEVGGIKNGLAITEVTEDHTVNTLGNPTFVSLKFEDKDSASSELGSIWTTEVTSTFSESQTDWCLALPLTRSDKRILPGGTNQTRAASWQVATAQCRVTQETIEPGAGSLLSLVTDVGYDSCGNVSSISSFPAGTTGQQRTTTIDYGTRCQRPESITNPLNQTSNVSYNWPLALPSNQTDPNGIAVGLFYDGFGRLTQRNNPDGTDAVFALTACTSANSWCGKDNSVRVKVTQTARNTSDIAIRTEEQFLDGFGRARWVHSNSLESGPALVQTAFDAFGRPNAQSRPYFAGGSIYSTVYTRDLIGRVTQANAPISETQANGRITGLAYEGRDLKVTDPKGNITTRRSNALGQLRAVVDPSPGGTTNYAYHPFGELASITDVASNVTSWSYNLRGFLTATADPDAGTSAFEPNAFGETERIRDAKTSAPTWTTQFTYDKLSRPATRIESEGTTTWNWGSSAAAKNIGRLASITSPASYSEVYSFDSLGRLAQQSVTADGTTYDINLTYVIQTGLPDTLEYPVSTSGYRLKLAYEYANGLLKRVKNANSTTVFWEAVSTDAFGHVQLENFGNGVATFTDFDQASSLMLSREGGVGGGTGLIHSQVDWDLNGNLKQRIDNKLSPIITEDFYYDTLNRFDESKRKVGAGTPATNADVTLDAIGNISWKLGVGNYGYHATKKRAVITAGSNTFGYDANGNMTSRNGASIGYTSYNLPNVINAPGGYSSTLSYGAFRNRFKQVAVGAAGTETTIYVAGLLEKVTRGASTEYRHFIHGGQRTAAIYTRASSGTNTMYYLHRDHLGSPELVTDSAGAVLLRPSFAAYGERRDGSDWDGPPSSGDLAAIANISRRGFTGHEHLDAVNLIHMNGRVYEPVAGRFLSIDPLVGVGLSQDVNSYSYVWNNPLNVIDPSGLDEEPTPLPPVEVTGQSLAWLLRLLEQLRMQERDIAGGSSGGGRGAGREPKKSGDADDKCSARPPMTLAEANTTFRENTDPSKTFTIDASQLTVKQEAPFDDDGYAGGTVQGDQWSIHGQVTLFRDAGGTISIQPETYHFLPHDISKYESPWKGIMRNLETYVGFYVATLGGITEYLGENDATNFNFEFECAPNVVN